METESKPAHQEIKTVTDKFIFRGKPYLLEREFKGKELISITQKTPDGEIVSYEDSKTFGKMMTTEKVLKVMGIKIDDPTILNILAKEKE